MTRDFPSCHIVITTTPKAFAHYNHKHLSVTNAKDTRSPLLQGSLQSLFKLPLPTEIMSYADVAASGPTQSPEEVSGNSSEPRMPESPALAIRSGATVTDKLLYTGVRNTPILHPLFLNGSISGNRSYPPRP